MSKKKALQQLDAMIVAQKTAMRGFLRANALASNDDQRVGSRVAIGICETTLRGLEQLRAELVKDNE